MRNMIRYLVSGLQVRKKRQRQSVFLYCSRRGGSTMLMQALASSINSIYIDQPYSGYSASNKRHLDSIPFACKSEMLFLDDEDEAELHELTKCILEGRFKFNTCYRIFRKEFSFFYDRTILKITNAKSYIKKFDDAFSPINIVLLRHPLLVAKSCCDNNWGVTNHAFLNNKIFVETALTAEQYEFSMRINESGTLLEKHILNWFLDNKLVVENAPIGCAIFRYEDLIDDPVKVAESLKKVIPELSVNCFERSLSKPSKSSAFSKGLRGLKLVDNSLPNNKINNFKANCSEGELTVFAELRRLFPSLAVFYE